MNPVTVSMSTYTQVPDCGLDVSYSFDWVEDQAFTPITSAPEGVSETVDQGNS